ncbi:PREDICTED: phenolic glucoside malonyltransferase 1 [Camelina sativa]|uniref:Phenolic glucoside malonyltransferase 1 n=1 Tax=Camelina sativa TaxID=90675 RepID=A0ABM0UXB6_CAMSA|nr:PREDICTED: phenolic glucoside malonyltransferase 1 [Camelina sativa]
MDSSVNIIEVAQVTPSHSESFEPLTLPLTFFDLVYFKFRPVERVIFYRLTNATRLFFDSVIIPNLKTSLSSALFHYLPLAGQLVWGQLDPKPSIVCSQNDAVSFTVAESNAYFSRLSGDKPFPSAELYPLVPELQSSDDSASVVSFQVTLFPNQGFCICVKAHHGVLDGKTTTMFLRSWVHICKHQDSSLPQDLLPTYDRTVIRSPTDSENKVLNEWHSLAKILAGGKEPDNPKSLKLQPSMKIGANVVRYTLELTRNDIQKLRERLKRESTSSSSSSSSSKELRLSTFVIAYSYAFVCLIRARGGEPKRPVGYGFSVDCRSLIDPPIPSYFGNCISGCYRIMLIAETFMGEEGLLAAARMVSESIEEWDESMAWRIPDHVGYATLPPGSQNIIASGSTRFGVYELDFGWGRPDKVMTVSIGQGNVISMADNRDGKGGVEIGFSLKEQEMDALIVLLHHELNR